MEDKKKTKKQLIEELKELRMRSAAPEKEAFPDSKHMKEEEQKQLHKLAERVKELDCLYGISNLIETPDISIEGILQGTLELLPWAWQYPSLTCARIILQDQTYETLNFKESSWRLASDIKMQGKLAGMLEVCYLQKPCASGQDPFLPEEAKLLDAVAELLGRTAVRKCTEDSLRFSNAILSTQQEMAPDGILVVDPAGKMISWNQWFVDMWSIPADVMETQSDELAMQSVLGELIDPEQFLFEVRRLYDDIRATSRDELALTDGRVFDRHSAPMIGMEDMYYGRVWYFRDITERKQTENGLRESEARYRSLFENSHAVMLIIDPDNAAIIDANQAACIYYGWSREELMKRGIDKINTLSSKEVAAEIQLARSEKRNHFFFKHRRADGTIRDVEVYSGAILLKGKDLLYSIVHDITERRQAEESLVIETHQLAETNTTLRVLLQRREEDQKEMEREFLDNIRKLVFPHLDNLRSLKLNEVQANRLDMLAANLQQVISPFLKNLSAFFADFTPREIQIANMIREGKTSKEIASLFNSSTRSIEFHRDNIRKKLGLNQEKSNLSTFLRNLSE